jgi:hypothetical protein
MRQSTDEVRLRVCGHNRRGETSGGDRSRRRRCSDRLQPRLTTTGWCVISPPTDDELNRWPWQAESVRPKINTMIVRLIVSSGRTSRCLSALPPLTDDGEHHDHPTLHRKAACDISFAAPRGLQKRDYDWKLTPTLRRGAADVGFSPCCRVCEMPGWAMASLSSPALYGWSNDA